MPPKGSRGGGKRGAGKIGSNINTNGNASTSTHHYTSASDNISTLSKQFFHHDNLSLDSTLNGYNSLPSSNDTQIDSGEDRNLYPMNGTGLVKDHEISPDGDTHRYTDTHTSKHPSHSHSHSMSKQPRSDSHRDGSSVVNAIDLTYNPSDYRLDGQSIPLWNEYNGQIALNAVKLSLLDTERLSGLLHDITAFKRACKNKALAVDSDVRKLYSLRSSASSYASRADADQQQNHAASPLDNESWYLQAMQRIHGIDVDDNHVNGMLTSPRYAKQQQTYTASTGKQPKAMPPSKRHAESTAATSSQRTNKKPKSGGRGRNKIKQNADDLTETDSDYSDGSDAEHTGTTATTTYVKRESKPKQRRRREKVQDGTSKIEEEAVKKNTPRHWWQWIDEFFAFPTIHQVAHLKPIENINNDPDMRTQLPPVDPTILASQKLVNSCVLKSPNKSPQSTLANALANSTSDTNLSNSKFNTDLNDSLDNISKSVDEFNELHNEGVSANGTVSVKEEGGGTFTGTGSKSATTSPTKKQSKKEKVAAKDIKINGIYDEKIKRQVNELERSLLEITPDDDNVRAYSQHKHTMSQRLVSALIQQPNTATYNPFTFSELLARRGKTKAKGKKKRRDGQKDADEMTFEERVRCELQALQLIPYNDDIDVMLKLRADDEVCQHIRELQDKLRAASKQTAVYKQRLHPLAVGMLGRQEKLQSLTSHQQNIAKFVKKKKTLDEQHVANTLRAYREFKKNNGDRRAITGYDPDPTLQRGIPQDILARMPPSKSYWEMIVGENPDWIRQHNEQQQQEQQSKMLYKALRYSPPPSTLLTAANTAAPLVPSPSTTQHLARAASTSPSASPPPTLSHPPILPTPPPPPHHGPLHMGKYNPSISPSSSQRTPVTNAPPTCTHRSRPSVASNVSTMLPQAVIQQATHVDSVAHAEVALTPINTSTNTMTSMNSQYQQYQPSPNSANRLIPDSMLMMGNGRIASNDDGDVHPASSVSVVGVGEIGMLSTMNGDADFDWANNFIQPTASIGNLRLSNTLADDELFMDM